MGPFILLDKSAFQSLSLDEIYTLSKHYFIVIPSILIMEIIADLRKDKKGYLSADDVRHLANKLMPVDSQMSTDYQAICVSSLLGQDIPMNGNQVVIDGGVPLKTEAGKIGYFFDESPIWKSIRDWQQGVFTIDEEALASYWRQLTKGIDLERNIGAYRRAFPSIATAKTLKELADQIETQLNITDASIQYNLLSGLMDEAAIKSQQVRNTIAKRWLAQKLPLLKTFAPYAYYCFKVNVLFSYGVVAGLITTRATNRIDLEYMYYLPFCRVFASRDKFHQNIAIPLMRDNQDYVDGDILKKDLIWLENEWNSLDEKTKEQRAYDYGSYPPDNPNSITAKLWKKHMKPWTPGSGNRAIRMTKEQNEVLMKKMKPAMDAIKRYQAFRDKENHKA